MSPEHHNQFPAIRNGDDVNAEGRTYNQAPIDQDTVKLGDDISSHSLRESSINPTTNQSSYISDFAPTIRTSNQTHAAHTTYIIPDSAEYDKTPCNRVQASQRDVAYEQPQTWVSTLKTPFRHLHRNHDAHEDSERRYMDNLERGRDVALSAECDLFAKGKIDTTKGSIRGLFGRGRHRDAWLIGCDTDATDFGGKVEGKIDAGRNRLSSSGTGRDRMVGTIIGREKLAREQDMNINSLLAARERCTRRRTTAGCGVAMAAGSRPHGEPEASGSGQEISVVRR